jgi:hypothetical protein
MQSASSQPVPPQFATGKALLNIRRKKCAPGPKKALTGAAVRRQYSGEMIRHRCLACTQATGTFRVCYIVSC